MRLHRFYTNQPLGEEIVKVESLEFLHQIVSVFRYKINSEVILFSGDGYDYRYSIISTTKKEAVLKLIDKTESICVPKKVTLYMSLVKKDTFEQIVRSCTEIGVTQIVPIISERSEKKNLNLERLHYIAIEASEQCGRGDVPVISQIISLKDAINNVSGNENRIVASLYGEKIANENIKKVLNNKDLSIFVGPEGGWSEGEEKIFDESGFTKIKLTDTVLKADTGAQAIVSLAMLL